MQSGWDSWDTCSSVNMLSLGLGERSEVAEVAEVEGGKSPTTECGAMDDLREWAGASEDRRPENGDRVGDLDK